MSSREPGDIRFSPKVLRDILQNVEEHTGVFTLQVSDGPEEKVIYFSGGGVRLLSVGDRSGIGIESALLSEGIVDVETLHDALEEVRTRSRDLSDVLADRKVLTREEYVARIQKLVRDELLDLVFWSDAYFLCYGGAPPQEFFRSGGKALACSFDLKAVSDDLVEWTRQWEVFRQELHSDRAIIRLTSLGFRKLDRRGEDEKKILKQCMDPASLRTVWLASGVDLPPLCKALKGFLEKGWISVSPPPRDAPSSISQQIAQLEDNLPHMIGKDLAREKLAALYEKAGMRDKALSELRRLADSALAQDGQWPLAVARLMKILSLRPESVDVLESVVKLQLQHDRKQEAVGLVNAHVLRLIDEGRLKEARGAAKILRSLLGVKGWQHEHLACMLEKTPEAQNAVEQYLALAFEYEQQGDRKLAAEMICHALKLAPRDERLLIRLRDLDPVLAASHSDPPPQDAKDAAPRASGQRRAGPQRRVFLLAVLLLLVAAVAALHFSSTWPVDRYLELLPSFRPRGAEAGPGGGDDRAEPRADGGLPGLFGGDAGSGEHDGAATPARAIDSWPRALESAGGAGPITGGEERAAARSLVEHLGRSLLALSEGGTVPAAGSGRSPGGHDSRASPAARPETRPPEPSAGTGDRAPRPGMSSGRAAGSAEARRAEPPPAGWLVDG
ncbi:MAG: hypothetical protein JXA90_05485, partial [Planctomycetes bacterium]|nr:hypothetical protein [Planctomycetota bacterium]